MYIYLKFAEALEKACIMLRLLKLHIILATFGDSGEPKTEHILSATHYIPTVKKCKFYFFCPPLKVTILGYFYTKSRNST